ncbi:putative zinc-binding protein [Candidatus Fermentibacteria bacterium]|nr:putative zinc-binding protein [Candidatus Fermentibacteria bacterium]
MASDRCSCQGGTTLVFACSGGADVGEISDRAARLLDERDVGSMYCLAGVGGRVSGIVKSTEAADRVIMIDGCPLDCGRRTLEEASIRGFTHLRVTDLGFTKGDSPPTSDTIECVAQAACAVVGSVCDSPGASGPAQATAPVCVGSQCCGG